MQLLLHIGTNKTGSSFLQTMLGRSRELLLERGIFFPMAEREEDMLAGKISPGNGGQLCRQLVQGNAEMAGSFLKSILNQAKQAGCKSVLISNEKLIRALSHPGALALMVNRAQDAGFGGIKVLAIFREPVEHALSLYQHRAKEGRHSDFNRWLNEDYETIKMLENFLPQFQLLNYPVEWTFRKYDSSPKKMIDILFTDWLKIAAPDVKSLPAVNPSLSLSEIKFLQLLRLKDPMALKPAKAAFDLLTKQQKASDKSIKEHLSYKAFLFINERRGVFDALNEKMNIAEKLQLLPEPQPSRPLELGFSPDQLNAVVSAIKLASDHSFRLRESLANGVKIAKRKLFIKPKLRDMYNLEP